ncbi:hypothetical protein PMIN06_008854 [Paraphaeosphaeria minitans]
MQCVRDMWDKNIEAKDHKGRELSAYVDLRFVQELTRIFNKSTTFMLEQHEDLRSFLQLNILQGGCVQRDHIRKLNAVIHFHWRKAEDPIEAASVFPTGEGVGFI